MSRLTPVLILCACIALSTCPESAAAATVYKTVDENGTVSFSDTPPAPGVPVEVLRIDVPASQSTAVYLEQLEVLRAATDRMAADRREREKHRAELRELRARTASHTPDTPGGAIYLPPLYYPAYPLHPRPPWRPGYRPRPEHPIARPPLHPAHGASGSANHQLMRPLVSSSRGGSGSANAQLRRSILDAAR
jgi:hypothetical protein